MKTGKHHELLQNIVRGMLRAGLVEEVLAFGRGLNEADIVPLFIADQQDVERIVAISYYPGSLAKLVARYGDRGKKSGWWSDPAMPGRWWNWRRGNSLI